MTVIMLLVNPEMIKPRKTPNADFKDFSKFLFKIISPVIAPIKGAVNNKVKFDRT